MNGELIFYLANRTAANEAALRGLLGRIGVELQAVANAAKEGELRYALKQAVDHSNLIFVVGGREALDGQDSASVLARALTSANMKKSEGDDWLLLQSGRQTVLSLPDEPDRITKAMEDRLLYLLSSQYSLPLKRREPPPSRNWTLPLEERPGPEQSKQRLPAMIPEREKTGKRFPVWAAVLLGAAAVAGAVLWAIFLL